MVTFPLLLLIAATSALAVLFLRLPRQTLRQAAAMTLEIFGFGVAFLVLNIAVAVLTALVLRRVTGFVSLYASNDFVLVFCSLLQGMFFATWRRVSGRGE